MGSLGALKTAPDTGAKNFQLATSSVAYFAPLKKGFSGNFIQTFFRLSAFQVESVAAQDTKTRGTTRQTHTGPPLSLDSWDCFCNVFPNTQYAYGYYLSSTTCSSLRSHKPQTDARTNTVVIEPFAQQITGQKVLAILLTLLAIVLPKTPLG